MVDAVGHGGAFRQRNNAGKRRTALESTDKRLTRALAVPRYCAEVASSHAIYQWCACICTTGRLHVSNCQTI
eukprot:15264321-Alexandrium_andersonii.AAC.1